MVNENEVRRNNWVSYDNRYFQIDTIAKEFPTLNTIEFGIGVVDWNNLHPIPLTEEVLLNIKGLQKRTVANSYYYINRIFYISEIGVLYDYATRVELPYLHTLQNFIFSLTGEELEVNL